MATSETGTSTSNPLGGEYQVFLSFREPDTRHGFADVLYRDLSEARIHVFIDHEEIRPGERIDGELLRAINDSRLYIPIFSPKYASSYWCLRELVMMVEKYDSGKDENKKVILPVFYNVKPDDVKLRTTLYENDIQKLAQTMNDKKKNFSSEDANTWRQALKTVGAISGLDLKNFTSDGALSKSVVKEVVNRLQTRQREVTKHLVGMEDRIAEINKLLDINSGGVRLIGIYGMGGMGKTTLARIIYNQLCPRYGKYCSFLDDVREMAKTKGLVELQKQLLFDISDSRATHEIVNDDEGIKAIEGTICNKEVLVVLDDVNDSNQIQKLIGRNSLCPGTRILVTTRDSGVLNIRRVNYQFTPYELEGLRDEHALQLFSKRAFDDNSPPDDYNALSKDIICTASGLPLALQAIGSLLFHKEDKKAWKEILQQLRNKPQDDVMGKLRITYDDLKPHQQDIFLDIACFFINEEKTEPVFMWRDCGFGPNSAIDVLTKKCMIKVLDNNKFWMHDQFRDLGREIAKEGHTRLWDTTDIIHKLRSTEEKHSVQALYFRRQEEGHSIDVKAEEIKRFPRLRFLWLTNVCLQGNLDGCLPELRWFYLSGNMFLQGDDRPFMPNLHLQNKVVLHTRYYEWTEGAVKRLLKEATKLKVLIIDVSYSINGLITFSEDLVLEKLRIFLCPSLKIDRSIRKLRQLTYLEFENCDALRELPEQIGELKNLQHLAFIECKNLRKLPDSVLELESLTELVASESSITRLPRPMSKLTKLCKLDLSHSNKIRKLPKLPRSLTTLKFSSLSLRTVPDVSNLTNLVELVLSDDHYYRSNPSTTIQPCDLPNIGRLSNLRKQVLCLLNVRATSVEWGSFSLLEELCLFGLDLQTLKQLPSSLRVLRLMRTQVKQIGLDGLPNLEELTIKSCEPVASISITSSLNKLGYIEVGSCNKLVEVQFRGILKSIRIISFCECESFERLVCLPLQAPELTDGPRRVSLVSSSLKMLQKLDLQSCPGLQEIQFVATLEALIVLFVRRCILLERLGGLSNLPNLNNLRIESCEKLQVVEDIDKLERLQNLNISNCRSMERIIDTSISKIPEECQITILNCGQLLDTGSNVSSITWECYRKMILNAQTQASDSAIETTFSETGDPLLEQQDDGGEDDDNHEHGGRKDDDDEDNEDDVEDDDDEDNVHEDHESDESEDDEVNSVQSSCRSLLVCSEDDNDENDDVNKEGEGESDSDNNSKDDEDEDDDDEDDGKDDEDNNLREVLQSSHGTSPVYSVGDSNENNDVNEEGDSDEDRTRMRGTMKKPKRRFHKLSKLDEGKRSCRSRLAGHNERGHKSHMENMEEKRQVASMGKYVGTDDQVNRIMSLMNIDAKDKRMVVVIHGEAGIGKTTLAKLIYNQVSWDFDGCSFLTDITETTQELGGLQLLQTKLISDVLNQELEDVAFVSREIEFFRDSFCNMRVLIILDDVENAFHVEKLIGDGFDCFASGSRILVTTRNNAVLEESPQIRAYHVRPLDKEQALQLLRQHASIPTSLEILNSTLNAMAGLPLFIEVMGAVLNGTPQERWSQLSMEPMCRQQNFRPFLEKVYQTLDYKQKQIFLDIACFTTGIHSQIAWYLWDDSSFLPSRDILTPLAKIGENNQIWMHSILRQFGREIVSGENHTDPGSRSRLFNHEIALDTIRRKKGTEKVEALCLNFHGHTSDKLIPEDLESMPNLRFLQLDHADIAGDFTKPFPKLRWLRWRGCPRHLQITNFQLGNLTILDLSWSKVTKNWEGWDQIEMKNLRVLDLTGCVDLLVTPKFSGCQNLAILILEQCSQLVKIDHSIGDLKCLVSLNLKFCAELSMLPVEVGRLTTLQELLMDGTSVQEIPISIGHLKQLKILSASNCFSLSQLPRTICHLTNISLISLDGTRIAALPDSIGQLVRLKHLSLRDCRQIRKLPNSIGNIGRSLVELDVSGTGISKFPDSLKNLQILKVLRMDSSFFTEFPPGIKELTGLEELHASWCQSLEGGLPSEIGKLHNLRILRLQHSAISSIPLEIHQLSNLRTLDLLYCDMIKELPRLPSSITFLTVDEKLKTTHLP